MEPLWSPVVATGGNQPQTYRARRRRKQAKSVATVCHQLPEKFHGRRGRRFESVRGLFKRPAQRPLIAQSHLLLVQHAVGMEPCMAPSGRKLLLRLGPRASLAVIESRRKVADLMVAFGTTIGLRFVSADPEERSYIERV